MSIDDCVGSECCAGDGCYDFGGDYIISSKQVNKEVDKILSSFENNTFREYFSINNLRIKYRLFKEYLGDLFSKSR